MLSLCIYCYYDDDEVYFLFVAAVDVAAFFVFIAINIAGYVLSQFLDLFLCCCLCFLSLTFCYLPAVAAGFSGVLSFFFFAMSCIGSTIN